MDGETTAKSSPDDLVTAADVEAERAITQAVSTLMPEARVIGEEAVAADPSLVSQIPDADCAVILDPVDGTWNFAHGLSVFGMILAVSLRGETVLGLLYDPVMDDLILARRGGGTWFIRPGHVQRQLFMSAAPVRLEEATAFLPLSIYTAPSDNAPPSDLPRFRRAWSLRCSCHEYRTMTQGGADINVSDSLNPWDHAAGVLAVTEAGGAVAQLDGSPYPLGQTLGRVVAARSPALLDAALRALEPVLA